MSERVRVVLVDDQEMVRAGLRMILEANGIDVVGEAANGRAAVDVALRARPDVVLMDIRMPVMDGLEATAELRRASGSEQVRVVILTTFDLDEYVYRALQAGAAGFVLKDAPPDELLRAISAVASGDALLSPSITRRLIEAFAATPARAGDPELAKRLASLTARERDVLLLVAQGLSNAEIGDRLFLGEATIKSHVSGMLLKLGVRDRVQAVIAAYEGGLVTPGG